MVADWIVIKATEKSTISPLKILSEDGAEEQRNSNNGEQAAKDPTLTGPQTAGMTSGVSGEVDKGTHPLAFPLLENGHAHYVIREIVDEMKKG